MTYPSRKALISGGRGRRRFAGLDCSRFSSSRICWQTPTHSLQMYERGYSDGELMSFSTCSCVLWQKEQRKGSSGVNRFTDRAPLPPSRHTQVASEDYCKPRMLSQCSGFIALTTNALEQDRKA